ncbi:MULTISPECIES: diacylglycerol/lipid kinase family protein [unclassified Marinitoga]|uniref:diacylglycerol/lipid kinase family protein n=1 Tax=unclassified Marinitoga TaxID=2640159 RepID=UPI000657C9EA|nr:MULTISPECIES: diacylglycerol kinase family protein [unclassified Marinitoga]KLO25113.1 diacylglycerol kinase [Marinitoga sp. 1155]
MEKIFVIVNPNSAGSNTKEIWPDIKAYLKKAEFSFKYAFTKGKMHAKDLTIEAIKEGFCNIICVGGDGTFNEIVNGVFSQNFKNPEDIVVGIIPSGTGNDWGKTVGIPDNYIQAIDVLKRKRIFVQDVGRVEYYRNDEKLERFFVNIAGMFFDAEVTRNANKSKEKNKGGSFSYLLNLLTTLFKYNSQSAEITIDNYSFKEMIFTMAVGICKYSGGGMKILPHAIPDDGFFDITLVKDVPKLLVIKNIKKIFDGSFVKLKWVKQFKAKKVEIKSKEKIYLEVDGESLGHSPFKFIILKKVLNVFGGE